MASVYLRGRVWWGRWRAEGRTVRGALSTATSRDEALTAARENEAAAKLDDTEAERCGSWTLGRVFDGWLAASALKHADKPDTTGGYAACLNTLPQRWRTMRADSFPAAEVAKFQHAELDRGIENSTLNNRVGCLISALKWAARTPETGVRRLPEISKRSGNTPGVQLVDLLKVPKDRPPVRLEDNEVVALLAHVCDTDLEPLVRVALWTGMRQQELCHLRWDIDVKLDAVAPRVEVQARKATETDPAKRRARYGRQRAAAWSPKSGSRTIPLAPDAVAWLTHYRTRQRLAGWPALRGQPVCLGPQGKMWLAGALGDRVAKVWGTLGFTCDEGHTLHMLRHTYAMRFLEAGGNLRTLQSILGHAKLETTAIYLRATDKGKEHDVRKMPPLPA